MLNIAFTNCGEIRMGSPFQCCAIVLEGPWVPDIPTTDWQNLSAASPDGRYAALVRWDTPRNEPGFRLFTVDLIERAVRRSRRISGCCEALWWEDGQLDLKSR